MADLIVPRLAGYVTLPEAADMLGMTRQNAHLKMRQGYFRTICWIGNIYLVREEEVERLQVAQAKKA